MFKNRGWTIAMLALALLMPAAASAKKPKVDKSTHEAILGALDDERRSEALYRAIMAQIGEVKPFTNVARAEVTHASHIEELMGTLGMEVPGNPWREEAFEDLPESRADACVMAAKAELNNIALYDDFLRTVSDDATRGLFEVLRGASKDHHLPAFERCSGNAVAEGHSCSGCARGRGAAGQGAGPGPGSGQANRHSCPQCSQ